MQASAGNGTVTQDFDLACLEGKAPMDEIASESTCESLQLRLPWDVWIGHASNTQKGEVYTTQKDREVEFDQYWRQEAGTPRSPRGKAPLSGSRR